MDATGRFALNSLRLGQKVWALIPVAFHQVNGFPSCPIEVRAAGRLAGFEGDKLEVRIDKTGEFMRLPHSQVRFPK